MTATATPQLAQLPPQIAEFCERAVEALRAALPVREVWLFGSYAEGTAEWDSDVDLFVVLADDHGLDEPGFACFRVVSALRDRPAIDVAHLSESQWKDPKFRGFGMWEDIVGKGVRLL